MRRRVRCSCGAVIAGCWRATDVGEGVAQDAGVENGEQPSTRVIPSPVSVKRR